MVNSINKKKLASMKRMNRNAYFLYSFKVYPLTTVLG
jgi:hypothetical protein